MLLCRGIIAQTCRRAREEDDAVTELIVDAHHHIWRLAKTPWLQGPPQPRIFGAYEPLRRDYPIEEYLADAEAAGVVRSVFVQVNVAPGEEVEEVAWVQSVADRHGFPHGIVGFADLASPALADVLDRQMQCQNLRSIRQQLHWHENPQYRFAPRPDAMEDPAWRRGLREVQRRRLLFELQVFASQMPAAVRLAQDFPELTFVLLHAGMLEDRSEAGWALWRQGMTTLAGCPNVNVKLSGLGTFDRACSADRWRPVVEATVDLFGATRCVFGSNFPIEKLWTSYAGLVDAMRVSLEKYSREERRSILHDNAIRLYRL
jgi:predicted TIM-barrel fold metal-dependent hydrolase